MTGVTYCQVGQCREVTSAITGHKLRVNAVPDKFLVVGDADFHKLPALVMALEDWLSGQTADHKIQRDIIAALRAFAQVGGEFGMCAAIDRLVAALLAVETKRMGQKTAVISWLQRLWEEGFVALPVVLPFKSKVKLSWDPFGFPANHEWIMALRKATPNADINRIPGLALRAATTVLGVKEVGDLVPDAMPEDFFTVVGTKASALVTPLVALQRAKYGNQAHYTLTDWGVGRKSRGNDRSYRWVLVQDASLSDWQEKIVEWLKDGRSLALRTYMADRLFACLIEHKALPRTVEEYCRRSTVLAPTWPEWVEGQDWAESSQKAYTNYFSDFLDWFLARYLTGEDDLGRPVVSPAHFNPITRLAFGGQPAQTHREAMPLRYIHELIRIVEEDDFAWPRTLSPSEYFMRHDFASGEFVKTWSPVRSVAILLKLHLPLRTFQVRMLDSGEGDSERFDGVEWRRNTGPLAPKGKGRVQRGFLRKMTDTTSGASFTGLYVNTNKTADIFRSPKDLGYEVPWEHKEVIRWALFLTDWQQAFNPIQQPTSWADIHDKTVLRSNSKEALRQRGEACFLFRDPKGTHPWEPVADSRLQNYWAMLLSELERRVAARGETLIDGSPIRFVRPANGTGLPTPLFDLHSLRVALITAYAIEGGVPIQILSKCVAGHATILMTLYYTKPGPAYVSEEMARAQQRIEQAEQSNFLRFLKNAEIREVSPLVVTNDAAALDALDANEQSGWAVGDIGICPVGMGRCHIGGPCIKGDKVKTAFAPVPGGPKNCVRCRFFITGPAFLGGLVAKFNSTGVLLMEASERLRKIEAEICGMEDRAEQEELRHLGRAYDRRDRVLDEVDTIAYNWHACFSLVQRCKAALKTANGNGVSLVLAGNAGDLDAALTECSDFELYNAVCQVAAVYPNDSPVLPTLRRGRLLDAMLSRNGRRPVFATLSEEEALAVGNEFVTLLMARIGRAETVDLIEGRRMLESTGIEEDVDRLIAGQAEAPVRLASKIPPAAAITVLNAETEE